MSGFWGGGPSDVGTPQFLILLANVACASSLVCGAGLLAARLLRRRSASVQHAALLWSVALATISPAILALGMTANFGWLTAPAELHALPAVQRHVAPVDLSAASASVAAESVVDPNAQVGNIEAPDIESQNTAAAAQGAETPATWPDVWRGLVPGIVAVWAAGIVLRGGIFFCGWLKVRRLRRSLLPCPDRRIARLAADTFASLNLQAVPIVESPQATIPFCLGFFRPAIVLPEGLADDLRPRQLRLVLLHEIAHLERRDHWVALLQVVGGILIWWNPLLHAASRSLDCLREQICDDFVVEHAKQRRRYAEVLVQIAEWHAMPGLPHSLVSTLFGHDASDLETRVRRLLDRRSVRAVAIGRRAAACAAILGSLVSAPLLVPVLRAGDATAAAALAESVAIDGDELQVAGEAGGAQLAEAVADVPVVQPPVVQPPVVQPKAVQAAEAVDLEGTWLLHLPAGVEHEVEWVRIDKTHYRLLPERLNMAGVYELQGDQLVIEKAHDPRLTEFRWKLRASGSLLLVGQPEQKKIGGDYLGALMKRKDHTAQRKVDARAAGFKDAADLSGRWQMHLPAGVDRQIELTRIDATHYFFLPAGASRSGAYESKSDHLEIRANYHVSKGGLTMAGIYELKNDRLVIQEPDDVRLTEFQWQLRDDGSLVLVEQPSREKIGASYLGAVMKRTEVAAEERQVLD